MRVSVVAVVTCVLIWVAGCSQKPDATPASSTGSRQPSAEGARYRLVTEPSGARGVADVRATAQDGEHVVVTGRIGGDANPWVNGRAAFSLVDSSLRACSDIPGDACPTPWDYCCETGKLKTGKLLVKVVDDSGALIAADARELLGVAELDTLVVDGTLQKGDDGTAVLLARGIYVKTPGDAASTQGAHRGHTHEHEHEAEHEHAEPHEPSSGEARTATSPQPQDT